ncbi:hypothetical protein [Actinomadura madurae]|uniref:hypothetical protein n=1 Tax=Actinomadura madurae TaxID=1993 RepID=UPI0020D2524F|nr:hypothetical protein [Actinomadura madurae]MCQ0019115.1 hypothetical protein [Actinomadura madurae]
MGAARHGGTRGLVRRAPRPAGARPRHGRGRGRARHRGRGPRHGRRPAERRTAGDAARRHLCAVEQPDLFNQAVAEFAAALARTSR